MRCNNCGSGNLTVIDSRKKVSLGEDYIRRRRRCLVCKTAFTTYETRSKETELVNVHALLPALKSLSDSIITILEKE